MKVLNSIKLFAQKVLRAQATKYTVVCLLGVLIVGFLDENSIWSHFKNKQRISDLEEEIEKYNSELAIALLAFGALFIGYMVWSAVKPKKK